MRFLVVTAIVFSLAANLASAQTGVVRVPFQATPDFLGFVEDEFIVVFDTNTRRTLRVQPNSGGRPVVNVADVQALLDAHGAVGIRRQFLSARAPAPGSGLPDLTGHFKVRLAPGRSIDAAITAFTSHPRVDSVEKIGIHSVSATPNDPYFINSPNPNFDFDQWHLWDTHSIDADLAWDITAGDPNVVVAILDSGVRYFHVDLGGNSAQWGPGNPFPNGNIFINTAETPGDGVDNDNNGFVDDTIGWDFVENAGGGPVSCIDGDCDTPDNDPDDYNGHGTHVAGTVGAITNNGVIGAGVAGGFASGSPSSVANGCKILPLRMGFHAQVQGRVGGVVQMDWAAEALNYVADLVDSGVNVAAVNCSWGSSNSGGLNAAVDAVLARDVMVIHAAGNSNSSSADFLGGKAGVLNVAATNETGNGASFTNYGSWVDVAAPGTTILSTYRNPSDPDPTHHYLAVLDGTSMAAPHVAGIAALLESCNPLLTRTDKFNLIINNTDPYTDTRDLGSGIANARDALNATSCACDVVAAFSASADSGCVSLQVNFTDQSTGSGISSWAWDFGDGGTSTLQSPIHDYTVPGTYTVTLVVDNGFCSDTLSVTDLIFLGAFPDAAFTAAPDSGVVPLLVNFTDTTIGSPTAWLWDFGDGSTSQEQSPAYQYTTPGVYTVKLYAANGCGVDSLVQVDLVEATAACDVIAAFSASPDSGCTPMTVTFTDESTGTGISSWAWDFGDGGTSSLQSPTHEYTAAGAYTVTLVAGNVSCADTLTMADLIVAWASPVAAFSAAPDSGEAPMMVDFTDASAGMPNAWLWDFGDGTTSQEQHPSHEYSTSGLYTVKLVVSNECGVDSLEQVDHVEVIETTTSVLPGGALGRSRSWISPNPFTAGTHIFMRLERATPVELVVYDVTGRPVRKLVAQSFAPGLHQVPFDARDDRGNRMPSGIYFYRLVIDGHVETRKLILSR